MDVVPSGQLCRIAGTWTNKYIPHYGSVHYEDKDTHVTMLSCMTTDHDEPSIQILQGQPPTCQPQKSQTSKLSYTYIPRFGSQLSCSFVLVLSITQCSWYL